MNDFDIIPNGEIISIAINDYIGGEMQYYTMKECFDACGDDDIPFIDGSYNSTAMNSKEFLHANPFFSQPSLNQALSDKWQIKRAEQKVLSAEELLEHAKQNRTNNGVWNADDVKIMANNLISKCRKNYRLERDLEFRSFVEKARELVTEYEDGQGGTLFKELREELYQNLKPL